MDAVLRFLADQPLLLLACLLCLGAAAGKVKIGGVQLGPAAVLFAGLALASVGVAHDVQLQIPEILGTTGLVLFTYTVGVISGPSFFSSVRSGWKIMVATVGAFVVVAAAGMIVGKALGLETPVIAGTFAGALTNTPALAAASDASGGSGAPSIGYSIAYLWGVLGMLAATIFVLGRGDDDSQDEPVDNVTVRVDRTHAPTISDLERKHGGRITFTRHKRGHFANTTEVPAPDTTLQERDLVTVVGPRTLALQVAKELGHRSSHDIVVDSDLAYRRITLSRSELGGRRVDELDLAQFGAMVSRVRRGDVDLVATHGFVLQQGDRVRVIAPRRRMKQVAKYLGDSERGTADLNPTGLALGLAVGLLLGLVHIPLPGGGGFDVGAAAGTLVVGLVFGRLGRVGPVVTSMPHAAASTLSSLGMIIFLAYAGTKAGGKFVSAVTSDLGWKIAVVGFVVTTLAALVLVVAGLALRTAPRELGGVLGGAQTQPAILAFANERTGFDMRVGLGYALVYPAAMIGKIVVVQLMLAVG